MYGEPPVQTRRSCSADAIALHGRVRDSTAVFTCRPNPGHDRLIWVSAPYPLNADSCGTVFLVCATDVMGASIVRENVFRKIRTKKAVDRCRGTINR